MRAAFLIALFASACAGTHSPHTFVRMERTPCLGKCPVYTLTLHADGMVKFEGEYEVPTGRHWRKISPAAVSRLMTKAEHAPTWTCQPGRIVDDQPGAIVTVSRAGQEVRRINYNQGDPCAPRAIEQLLWDIDLTGGTALFVNGK
jgi:hypothetical protein